MRDWELQKLIELNAVRLVRPNPAHECLDLIKSEIRKFAQELSDLHYDPSETDLIINKLLTERNIDNIIISYKIV